MPKYLDIDGLRTLWAQITNKIGQESNATAEALEGKADLVEGKIPASQLPSYVDDVLEYANKASFPATGEASKIYVDTNENKTYRWSGSTYTEISASLTLGDTSSTAYYGDKGAAAYKHAVTNKGIAKSSGLYKITTNAEGHVTAATAVVKTDITGLGIPAQDTTYENATTTTNGLMSSTDKTKLNSINLSALVKSVNGITPDSNGNVTIEVGGGIISGEYLPLTGGTLTGNLTISNSNNYSYLYLANQNGENIGGLYASDGENRLYLINHAPNSTTGKYEGYGLPAVTTDNLTEHKWYKLLTSKEAVTIEQGGTGATTPEAARTALGITPANIGALALSGGTLTNTLKVPYLLIQKSNNWPSIGFNLASGINRAGFMYDGATNNRLMFKQYGADMDNASTRYGENYTLPKPTEGITAEKWYSILTSKNAVTIAQGGTGATDAPTACKNLGAATVLVGTEIPSNANLNNYTTPGTYRSPSGTVSATLSNAPYTATGFKLEVFNTTSSNQIIQEIKYNAGSARTYRRQASSSNGVWTFNSWYKVMQSANDALAIADGGTGATTAAAARTNLGITPANIGALPSSGGTLTGNLTISNSNNYSYLYLANQNGENIGGLYASDSENRLYLINHAPNSTAGKYEGYGLPAVTTDNLTEHKWYSILTSKTFVASTTAPSSPVTGMFWVDIS